MVYADILFSIKYSVMMTFMQQKEIWIILLNIPEWNIIIPSGKLT